MKDYSGKRFTFWKVLRFHEKRGQNVYWLCRCRCGNTKPVVIHNLRHGLSKSCGCGVYKIGGEKHGLTGTPIYKTWYGMKERCFYSKNDNYKNYGERGITVCEFILESPANLLSIVGNRPGRGWSIDRKNTNGHYSCGSCAQCKRNKWSMNLRWATGKQQCRNKRNNLIVELNGVEVTACEFAELVGVSRHAIYKRIERGEAGKLLAAPLHERVKISV